jgi:hypothetical protein
VKIYSHLRYVCFIIIEILLRGYKVVLPSTKCFFMQNSNNYPLREWHVEHMKKTIVKYVTGLSPDASSWQKRQHKKYNKIANIRRGISYDIKHGVTNAEVISFMNEVRNNLSFLNLRKVDGSIERLDEIEKEFTSPTTPTKYQW